MRAQATVFACRMTRDIAIAGLFALVAGAMPAGLAILPQPGAPVAVIAFPWAERGAAMRIVAAAHGTILDAAHEGTVAIAYSAASDFVTRLYRSGAALVVDGTALSRCLSTSNSYRLFVNRTAT
jgi:hypothetical protein